MLEGRTESLLTDGRRPDSAPRRLPLRCDFGLRDPLFLCFSSDPRGTHLWEFIRDILLNPDKNPGLIKWEDRSEGIFRFLKSEAVAQLWGRKKNNSSMTYEKLSRAMR